MPRRKRLLTISHHHPDLIRGGAQQAAYELFEGFAARPDYDAFFLAGVQAYLQPQLVKPGAHICGFGRPNEFLMVAHAFDYFWLSNTALHKARWYHVIDFLRELRPDIIHFNHTLHLGIELLRAAKIACPEARIVYTLHEFVPICYASGQMVRTKDQGLCDGASPTRCTLCFPERTPGEFYLRDRWIRAHFSYVDRFIVPSRFLMQRYLEWGIPADDIVFIDYGRTAAGRQPPGAQPATTARNTFGFFGQLIDCKGLGCVIDAVERLVKSGIEDFQVRIHGSNLDMATEALQARFKKAIETVPQIKFSGSYFNYDLPRLAAVVDWFLVPSIWWENSPLVIQEAFMARRPVLCSNIGGMAEKVRNEIDGLHFAVGDAEALANTMRRCITEKGLWDRLAANIPEILSVEEAVTQHRYQCFECDLPASRERQLWEAAWAEEGGYARDAVKSADVSPKRNNKSGDVPSKVFRRGSGSRQPGSRTSVPSTDYGSADDR